MKIQQLIEGQKEQIISLRPNSPLALYYPTDINGATDLIMETGRLPEYPVTPFLKNAVRYGDVVVQFYGQGRHLEASRMNEDGSPARQFPDSFKPQVSHKMLSNDPLVYYTGLISPSNIDKVYVMRDGNPEAFTPEEFVRLAIQQRADSQKQRMGLTPQ